jgi:hypothetical protein
MNRCVSMAVSAAALSLALAGAVSAQTSRPFPATALRGALVVVQPPDVQLNGQAARLAPGSRIRGADNMVQMSGTLVGTKLLVHYTLDPTGLVQDVWILTPDEAARKPWPATPAEAQAWLFNPAAQAWTKR